MLTDDARYDALLTRDPRFDGVFFVGVSTTGIYCRPICPARTPGRSRCTFYATPAQAEAAGHRACFRCRPELAPGNADIDAVDSLVALAAGDRGDRVAVGARGGARHPRVRGRDRGGSPRRHDRSRSVRRGPHRAARDRAVDRALPRDAGAARARCISCRRPRREEGARRHAEGRRGPSEGVATVPVVCGDLFVEHSGRTEC